MRNLLLVLCAGLLSGCTTVGDGVRDVVREIPQHTTLALLPGTGGPLGSRAALRFDAIVDSRCPANVMCIWAGKMSYRFTLTGAAAAESFLLDDNAPSHTSAGLAGVTVALLPATTPPPPVNNAGQPPTAHTVTLTVTRRPS